MNCSGSASIASCNINYALPSPGKSTADWVLGGLFAGFYFATVWGTYRAFKLKRTLRLSWISLLFFVSFRTIGYFMRAYTDDNQPQPDSSFAQEKSWVEILTASYSILSAGTTFFLIFCGSLVIAYRRCCTAMSSTRYRSSDHKDERRLRKLEDRAFIGYRIFVIAVAALNIVGSLRQFDYYWLDYPQGVALRKAGGWIQIIVTCFLIGVVLASTYAFRVPRETYRAFFLLVPLLLTYMVSQAFNLVRVYRTLNDEVNTDAVWAYCFQALPDLANLLVLLLFNFDKALDYEAMAASIVPSNSERNMKMQMNDLSVY
ncbi:hypothetical protein CBS101457_002968 [Exobasidium rhododendri]|nr:hypothetical protein CBS101457_002968 [Exobasidium rhododendri]